MTAAILVLVICIIVCLLQAADHYHDNAIIYKEQRNKKVSELKQATTIITDMQQHQCDADALGAKYTEELTDAKAENNALQRKLDNGGRVLTKGKCPALAATQTIGTASMGNDTTVELSVIVGQNVLGTRSGAFGSQTVLRTLQEYITTQRLE